MSGDLVLLDGLPPPPAEAVSGLVVPTPEMWAIVRETIALAASILEKDSIALIERLPTLVAQEDAEQALVGLGSAVVYLDSWAELSNMARERLAAVLAINA